MDEKQESEKTAEPIPSVEVVSEAKPAASEPSPATPAEAPSGVPAEAKPAKAPRKARPKATAGEEKGEAAAKSSKKKSRKKGRKAVVERGKRKESVARAVVREGKGHVRLNSQAVQAISNRYIRSIVSEPLEYLGPEREKLDVDVYVQGGGAMGQAQAARTAIARALVAYTEDAAIRQKMLEVDRSLLVEDSRRVEPKKYKGPKARARFQKSYR